MAVLCEEVVDGMIAANRFNDSNGERGNIFATTEATAAGPPMKDPVKVVLDLQHRDWRFVIQPGLCPTFSKIELLPMLFQARSVGLL